VIYLSRDDVEALLDMPTCIRAMRSAFQAVAEGRIQAPPRTVIRMADRSGFFGSMPIYASGYGSAAKVMTIYPGNHDVGLASHQGFILLFGEEDGVALAMVEAGSITEMRTAAVSGLATDLLAKSDATKLCILGSGVQARSHVRSMCCVRDISGIHIWSRTPGHAESFAAWAAEETGLDVSVHDTSSVALSDCDIVCTVTASPDPIVDHDALATGCHINAVGSFTPSARELDTETIRCARLFVDSRESALSESGDILTPISEGAVGDGHILAELSDLVTGEHQGRLDQTEMTVFKSLGVAVEDLVAAKAVYDLARSSGKGTVLK
jgi:ornithine cyclodeaminase/alanine dehydrogenase-like protein (mu-crystallin family)